MIKPWRCGMSLSNLKENERKLHALGIWIIYYLCFLVLLVKINMAFKIYLIAVQFLLLIAILLISQTMARCPASQQVYLTFIVCFSHIFNHQQDKDENGINYTNQWIWVARGFKLHLLNYMTFSNSLSQLYIFISFINWCAR